MPDRAYNLAIETSSPLGSVTLGRGDDELETAQLPPQRRHTVDLMPVIDRLFQAEHLTPADLGEVYISIGPGSFTGLRIAVTTAKMLAQVLGVKVVGVPTIEVLAQNAPPPQGLGAHAPQLGVCLNIKNETAYAAVFTWHDGSWQLEGQAGLMTMVELLSRAAKPVWILGDPLPASPDPPPPLEQVKILSPELAVPRSQAVWRLGRAMAKRGQFIDPLALLPLYARRPEAEELWEKRHPPQSVAGADAKH